MHHLLFSWAVNKAQSFTLVNEKRDLGIAWFSNVREEQCITSTSSWLECSAQGQIFHCKHRNQGCSSAQRQVLHRKLRNQGCSFAQRQVFHCKLSNQGCRSAQRQVFHRKLRNQGCSFTKDLIGAVASHCFPHPTLSLASEHTLKDLKRSQGHQLGGEESGFG